MIEEPRLLKEPRSGVPSVIQSAAEFDAALERFECSTGPVAADAERASGFRYGHEDWLIQFKRNEGEIYLFDPIALHNDGVDVSRLNKVISKETVIIHDALQDLPGFADLGLVPSTIFDTEFAARFLGFNHVGLSAVTEKCLGLSLAKEHSAADWSYRPLPRDWRNYAALDVELLIPLMDDLQERLRAAKKDAWAQAEFAQILRHGIEQKPMQDEPWRHTSHITALRNDVRGLAVVRALWTERDEIAQELDISPSLLLSDQAIVEAAIKKPHSKRAFESIRSLNQRVRIHTGSEQDAMFARYIPLQKKVKPSVWRETIYGALELPDSALPDASPKSDDPLQSIPHSMKYWRQEFPERFAMLTKAKAAIGRISEDTGIPVELILKPSILREMIWRKIPRDQIAAFLLSQGARQWQVDIVIPALSR
jgi:ribonuclease D